MTRAASSRVGAAPARADPARRHRARTSSSACSTCCTRRHAPRVRARRVPRAGPHDVLPPLVRRRPRRGRPLLRDGDARRRRRSRCSTRPAGSASGFCLGYAELTDRRPPLQHARSSSSATARIVATYRKVHIPGHEEHEPDRPFQHLERHYFEPGPDGFGVWRAFGGVVGMMICNDRRWPETYRVMGLQGVELILCGYNTPIHYAPDPSQDILQGFHNPLVMQAGAYQNGTWVVGVAKGGVEEGVDSLGAELHRRPVGPDRRPGPHRRATSCSWPAATSTGAGATRARCSTSTATAGPRSTARITERNAAWMRTDRMSIGDRRPQSTTGRSSGSRSTAPPVTVRADHPHLLAALREELDVTSPKDGCSPSGQCGCCTVLVDGKARCRASCRWPRSTGETVTTLEGVAERRARPLRRRVRRLRRAAVRVLHPRHRHAGQGPDRQEGRRPRPATTWPATSAPTSAGAPAT